MDGSVEMIAVEGRSSDVIQASRHQLVYMTGIQTSHHLRRCHFTLHSSFLRWALGMKRYQPPPSESPVMPAISPRASSKGRDKAKIDKGDGVALGTTTPPAATHLMSVRVDEFR